MYILLFKGFSSTKRLVSDMSENDSSDFMLALYDRKICLKLDPQQQEKKGELHRHATH